MQYLRWNGTCEGEEMMKYDLPRSQVEMLIDEWVFSERDRAILKRRLLDGVCYDDLADEFNLSPRHVKRIVYKAEDRLFKKI